MERRGAPRGGVRCRSGEAVATLAARGSIRSRCRVEHSSRRRIDGTPDTAADRAHAGREHRGDLGTARARPSRGDGPSGGAIRGACTRGEDGAAPPIPQSRHVAIRGAAMKRSVCAPAVAYLICGACVSSSGLARAQTAEDVRSAERLFTQGSALVDSGDYDKGRERLDRRVRGGRGQPGRRAGPLLHGAEAGACRVGHPQDGKGWGHLGSAANLVVR